MNKIGGETNFLTFGQNQFDVTVEREQNFINWCRKTPNALMLLPLVDQQVVGVFTLIGSHRPRMKHTGELGISLLAAYWGLGIGHHLIKAGLTWAKTSSPLRKINLRVHEHNQRALKLYQQFGFKEEGQITRDYLIDGKFYTNILMGLQLD